MARTLARISGVALRPGISRNAREYTREAIASAVERAQQRLASGAMPLSMLTHHGAEDSSTHIVGRVTRLDLAPDGSALFEAELADTDHGRTIASLVDPTGGEPFLKGVSIRGAWVGPVKRRSVGARTVEYADDLELDGLDFTKNPGVDGAAVQSFHRTAGARETDSRALIFESVEQAEVITETADEHTVPGCDGTCCEECGVNATESAPGAPLAEKSAPAPTKAPPGSYADPGYQGDKAPRFPVDTLAHARAAWSYIHQAKIAESYTPAQLKRIKGRIAKSLGKFGVKVDPQERWIISPAERVTEASAAVEHDVWPDRPGSYCVSIDNGMFSISISSYQVDPADLEMCARAAMEGACAAYMVMDPDADGDTDTGGDEPAEDDDESGRPDDDAMEHAPQSPSSSAAAPAAVSATETETGMAESTTPAAGVPAAAPATPAADPAAAAAAPPVTASAPTVTFTEEQFAAFLAALRPEPVAAGAPAESAPAAGAVAEAAPATAPATAPVAEPAPVVESQEQLVARLVAEGVRSALQDHAENGGVARKGLVAEQAVPGVPAAADDEFPESWPREGGVPVPAHKMTTEQWKAIARDTLPTSVLKGRG